MKKRFFRLYEVGWIEKIEAKDIGQKLYEYGIERRKYFLNLRGDLRP